MTSKLPSKIAVKATLLAGGSLTVMAGALIAPAIPQLSTEFNHLRDSEFLAKLTLTLPSLIIGLFAPVMGYLVDKTGRKPLLIFGLLLYAIAGTAGFLLNDLHHILISRAFLGIAVACNMTTITTLVADYFVDKERNQFMGLQGGFMAFGGIIYVILGGMLAMISWREPFLVYLASLLVLPLVLLFIREPERVVYEEVDSRKLDYPRKLVNFIFFIGFLGMVIFYMIPVQIPFFLTGMGIHNEINIGIAIACTTIAAAPAAISYQWLSAKFSFSRIYALGFLVMGIGYLLLGSAWSYSTVIGSLMVAGLGFGLMIPNASVWIMTLAPAKIRGRIIGSLNAAMFLGQFFSPVFSEPISDSTSLATTFMFAGGLMLVMAAGFFLWKVEGGEARVE